MAKNEMRENMRETFIERQSTLRPRSKIALWVRDSTAAPVHRRRDGHGTALSLTGVAAK